MPDPLLQVEGLRKLWDWNPQAQAAVAAESRQARHRLERENKAGSKMAPRLRAFVYFLPLACLFSLALRVEGRVNGWKQGNYDPDLHTLPMNDWSLRRAEIERWLDQQLLPQLLRKLFTLRSHTARGRCFFRQ
jgi:hypothetical protein